MRLPAVVCCSFFPLLLACTETKTATGPKPLGGADSAPPVDAGPTVDPLPGTKRYVFSMNAFAIEAGGESYKCQDFPNPFGRDVGILQSESVMTPGSHHMFAFRIGPNDISKLNLNAHGGEGPLVDCPSGGVEFHPYFHDAQLARRVFSYPPGVGRSLKATDGIRLMVHFLNTTDHTLRPVLRVTIDYVDATDVKALAAEYFLDAIGVTVPPGTSTEKFSYTLPSDIKVLSSVSHMHRHGTHFEGSAFPASDSGVAADAGDGQPMYTTDAWAEPKPADYDPPLDLRAGDIFRFGCTYQNDTTQTFTFGESAQSNEMCIFQGTFYPATDGQGIFGVPIPIGK